MNRGQSCLERLFYPIDSGEFLARFWPSRPLLWRGALDRIGLPYLTQLTDLKAILAMYRGPVKGWNRAGSVNSSPERALGLYETGHALYVPRIDRYLPELGEFLRPLERELGVPRHSAHCSIFAAAANSVIPMHFDMDFGFNILLQGRKIWKLAPNEHVLNPLVSHDTSRPGPDLQPYVKETLPQTMPKNCSSDEAGPGDVYFLPRGYWHETKAVEDCIALEFAVTPGTWLDVVLDEIRAKLLLRVDWRESVLGVRGTPTTICHTFESLREMLAGISEDINTMTAEDLVARANHVPRDFSPLTWFRRNPDKAMTVEIPEIRGRSQSVVKVFGHEDGLFVSEITEESASLCRRISEEPGPFTLGGLLDELDLEPQTIVQVISALEEIGAIIRCDSTTTYTGEFADAPQA